MHPNLNPLPPSVVRHVETAQSQYADHGRLVPLPDYRIWLHFNGCRSVAVTMICRQQYTKNAHHESEHPEQARLNHNVFFAVLRIHWLILV